MTFGVSRDHGDFEWAGTNLASVFAQRRRIFSPRMWRMIFDIVRFNQFALDLLIHDDQDSSDRRRNFSAKRVDQNETIGTYLAREGYSDAFRDDYLLPMAAAVWSTSPDKCGLDFPGLCRRSQVTQVEREGCQTGPASAPLFGPVVGVVIGGESRSAGGPTGVGDSPGHRVRRFLPSDTTRGILRRAVRRVLSRSRYRAP